MQQLLSPDEFKQVAMMLSGAVGKMMPDFQTVVYFDLLKDIPFGVLKPAVLRAIEESEQNFIPSVGMIRRLAAEAQFGVLPSWGQAWEQVIVCCRRLGRDRSKDAEEKLGPFTWRVVRQVGWREICDSETIGVQMSQFRDLYNSASQVETTNRRISEELRPVVGGTKFLTVPAQKRIGAN